MSAVKERRRVPRIKRRAAVQFKSGKKTGRGVILNFSEIGLFIQADELLEIGSPMTIPIQIGSDRVIELHGSVMWNRRSPSTGSPYAPRSGMGVELSSAPEEYLRFVAKMHAQLQISRRGVEERFEVYHRVQFQSDEAFLTEYTENLSRGGMFLATDQPLEPGTVIKAKLEIRGIDEPIEVEGKVAYRLDEQKAGEMGRSPGCGIQFVDLGEEAKSQLHHYIQRLEVHRSRPERRRVGEVPMSGSLNEFLVPELLLGYLTQEASGALILERHGISKLVYIKRGHPVYVESNLRTESLGHFLVRHGKITQLDLQESLEDLSDSDVHHGEIMVAGGMLDATTLAASLVEHQEAKLTNTFPWFEGKFEFIPGTDWPATISILPLRTYQVIFKGIGKWYDAPLIRAWMGLDENSAIRRVKMPPPEESIPAKAFEILNLAAIPQTIWKLAQKSKMAVDEVLPMAYAFIISGWAVLDFSEVADVSQPEFLKPKEEKTPEPAPPPTPEANELIRLIRRWVEEDFERLRQLDFLELFDLKIDATEADITRAYLTRWGRYSSHDVEEIADAEVRNKIQQIRSWIRLAYDTLRDPNLREIYVRKAKKEAEKPKDAESAEKADQFEADRLLVAGVRDLELGNIQKAISSLTLASQLYPNEPSIPGYLGWALFQDNQGKNYKKAESLLDQAIQRDPSDPQLQYYRGEIYLYMSDYTRAERCFSRAIKLQPNFLKASVALDVVRKKSHQRPAPSPTP